MFTFIVGLLVGLVIGAFAGIIIVTICRDSAWNNGYDTGFRHARMDEGDGRSISAHLLEESRSARAEENARRVEELEAIIRKTGDALERIPMPLNEKQWERYTDALVACGRFERKLPQDEDRRFMV